jgi:CRP-like cAMP-binding protein
MKIGSANKILAALPTGEYARMLPELKPIKLIQGDCLYRAGDACHTAWFLLDGLLSIDAVTEEGETMDVGMIGTEGTAGILAAFEGWMAPFNATVEISCNALQISAAALRNELNRNGEFHDILLKYTAFLYHQIAQSALCSRFHNTEQRMTRVLLAISNRIMSPTIPLTHEQLSRMIGAHRPHVTGILDALEAKKLVQLARGRIYGVHREGLETHACGCYHIIKEAMERYVAQLEHAVRIS